MPGPIRAPVSFRDTGHMYESLRDQIRDARSIQVYPLIPPEKILKHEKTIRKLLFGMDSAKEKNKIFRISPVSGCLTYSDFNILWKNQDSNSLPKTSGEVERITTQFLQEKNRLLLKNRIPPLFPRNPQVEETVLVGSPRRDQTNLSIQGSSVDHWLCRFVVYMSPGGLIPAPNQEPFIVGERAQVLGTCIEIRIGPKSKIIGFKSYWRPCNELPSIVSRIPEPLTSPDRDVPQSVEEQPSKIDPVSTSVPSINEMANPKVAPNNPYLYYVLSGEEEPQQFLAPYHMVPTQEPGSILVPASCVSLTIDITSTQNQDGSHQLEAVALGRYGELSPWEMDSAMLFNWMAWSIDETTETDRIQGSKILNLGTSRTARLPPGTYSVTLQVTDRQTKAIALTQDIIFTKTATHDQKVPAPDRPNK